MSRRRPKAIPSHDFASMLAQWSEANPHVSKSEPSTPTPRIQATITDDDESPEQMMQEAFERMAVDRLDPTEKFHRHEEATWGDRETSTTASDSPRGDAQHGHHRDASYLRAVQTFEDSMQDAQVDRWEQSLARVRAAFDEAPSWSRQHPRVLDDTPSPSPDDLIAPRLTSEQKKLIRRVQKLDYVPEVNLRLLHKEEAMRRLNEFVAEQKALGEPYVRVITGKGKHSQGEPVIKPAVMAWCAQQVALAEIQTYSPAPDFTGNYGTLILVLPTKRS